MWFLWAHSNNSVVSNRMSFQKKFQSNCVELHINNWLNPHKWCLHFGSYTIRILTIHCCLLLGHFLDANSLADNILSFYSYVFGFYQAKWTISWISQSIGLSAALWTSSARLSFAINPSIELIQLFTTDYIYCSEIHTSLRCRCHL